MGSGATGGSFACAFVSSVTDRPSVFGFSFVVSVSMGTIMPAERRNAVSNHLSAPGCRASCKCGLGGGARAMAMAARDPQPWQPAGPHAGGQVGRGTPLGSPIPPGAGGNTLGPTRSPWKNPGRKCVSVRTKGRVRPPRS